MGQKSLSEINEKIAAIKNFVNGLKGKVFGYTIKTVDSRVNNSKETDRFSGHSVNMGDQKDSLVEQFNREFDSLTAIPTTANIHVIICGRKKDDIILDDTVEMPGFSISVINNNNEKPEIAQPQQQPQAPNPQLDTFGQVANILGLLGFGGLAGTNDGTNGLSAILQVRDGLNEQRHTYEQKDDKITKLAADLARTELERDQLKQNQEKLLRQIDKRDERIEELEDEIDAKNEQIRKLHPELSLMGTSLTALLGAGIKNFAMNHANTIGGLMGIDGDALRSMLSKDEETAAIGSGEAEPDDNSDGRAEECKQIREFIKTLNDKEWDDFYQLMRVFAANKETIGIVLAMAKGSSDSGAPEQPNVEQ